MAKSDATSNRKIVLDWLSERVAESKQYAINRYKARKLIWEFIYDKIKQLDKYPIDNSNEFLETLEIICVEQTDAIIPFIEGTITEIECKQQLWKIWETIECFRLDSS